jgi:hypothetical protein
VTRLDRATRSWRRVTLLTLCFLSARVVQAQPAVEPPRVLELPEVVVPPELALPDDGRVEATIVIEPDGSAKPDGCEAGVALCALVSEALSRARFEPARRDGAAVSARIKLALRLARVAEVVDGAPGAAAAGCAAGAGTHGGCGAAADGGVAARGCAGGGCSAAADGGDAAAGNLVAAPTTEQQDPTEEGYGAHAKVKQIKQPGMRRLELAELRDMPGAFGDPFRAVEVLPGIVPILSGLPYFYVRGAPPAGSVYYYDGIPVPSLYHLALGPAVIHPQMVGPIRLYSGVAPARYGRLTGGVIVGEGPPESDGKTRGEAELRLLDASGFVRADALGGKLNLAGRYGYPGLIISLVSPDVSVAYWDYQLRYALPLSQRSRLELVSLGSYDRLSTGDDIDETLELQFHRIEPRYVYHTLHDELGVALMFGWERSALGETLELSSTKLSPRVWYEHRFDGGARLRLSADAIGMYGGRTRQSADDAAIDAIGFRELGRGYRSVLGAFTELTLPLTAAFELQAGARVDAWLQRGRAYPAVDPRVRAIFHATPTLDFHLAGGTTHQPAVPLIPLPGLSDFSSAEHLQSAIQAEAGVGVDLPIDVRAELQLFTHRYQDLVFGGLTNGSIDDSCERTDCNGQRLPSQIDGWSYGMELYLRRPFTNKLSGVLSYTLAWADVDKVLGLPHTPAWDVRHLVNLVLQWDIGSGFALGLRGFFRSGKSSGAFYQIDSMLARYERRMPGFFRGDLQFSYSWRNAWSRMRFGFEWFNFTISREAMEYQGCTMADTSCEVFYAPPIFAPNLSLRADIQ